MKALRKCLALGMARISKQIREEEQIK